MIPRSGHFISTILFDLDGVIIDSNDVIIRAWRYAAGKFGYSISDEMVDKFIIGASAKYTLSKIFPEAGPQQHQKIHRLVDQFEQQAECTLIPGVEGFLRKLTGYSVNIGLVTSSWPDKINHVLKEHHLDMFRHIVSRHDVSRGKPDPEPYITAIEKFSCRAAETLVFEDSTHGITAALSAGTDCIAIGNTSQIDLPYVEDFNHLVITDEKPIWLFKESRFGIGILTP